MSQHRRSILRMLAVPAFLATVAALAACGPSEAPPAEVLGIELSATREDSAGVPILTLSHTLAEVADGETRARVLQPDLLVGETKDEKQVWFGAVADVLSLGGGSFAVLDNMQKRVLFVDSVGNVTSTLGREGDGPGEFREPWALTRVGRDLVVRQNTTSRTFTVFDEDGHVRATVSGQPAGDWITAVFRRPRNFMIGYKTGPEDMTRRLRAFDSTSFVHMVEPDENPDFNFTHPTQFEAIPAVLVRYDLDGRILDTLAELRGPPTFVQDIWPGRSIFYTQPLYSGAPVWTTGAGWYAIGHGDSTQILVRNLKGDVLLRIRLPPRRRAVSEADRAVAAAWSSTAFGRSRPDDLARIRADPSLLARARQRLTADPQSGIRFADSIPHVVAAYGAGRCLFLSGYSPEDWPDGTSLTWVVINVQAGRVLDVFRLHPPPDGTLPDERRFRDYVRHGAAIREIDGEFAYAYLQLADGAQAVERFPLSLNCRE